MIPGEVEAPELPRRSRTRTLVLALLGMGLVFLFVGTAWYLTSAEFNSLVRKKVVAELERITGGQVELSAFHWNLSKLQFVARDLTIHGREAHGEIPFIHADLVLVRLKIFSFFGGDLGLGHVGFEHPVIHVITYPDGSTNQPTPKFSSQTKGPAEHLFELAISRLDLSDGILLVNDRQIPFDFTAGDLTAAMDYSILGNRYDGSIHIGKLDTKLPNWRPFASVVHAEFSLWATRAELKSIRWASGSSRLVGNGSIGNFRQPTLKAALSGNLNLAELGTLMRAPQFRGGVLDLNGTFSYSGGQYVSAGRVLVRDVDYAILPAHIHLSSAAADYSLHNDRLTVSAIHGRTMGGSITGDAQVVNWRSGATLHEKSAALRSSVAAQSKAAALEQQGSASLQLGGLSLEGLADVFSTPTLAFKNLNLAGSASGGVKVSWHRSPQYADATMNLSFAPSAHPTPAQLPVGGGLRANYHAAAQVLELSQLTLSTPASRLSASGTLDPSAAHLKLTATTSDLAEWQAIAAVRGQHLPFLLHGPATFQGIASGNSAEPILAGHLQATNFESVVPPHTVPAPATLKRVHWDLLSTDLTVSPMAVSVRRGVLRRGKDQAEFDISAALHNFLFTIGNTFSARLAVHNSSLENLESLAGYNYPVTGVVNLSLTASGTLLDPHGNGQLRISNATIAGEPVDSLTADLLFANGEAQVNDIVLRRAPASVVGNAAYSLKTNGFRFNLQGSKFDLTKIRQLQTTRLSVEGELGFSAQGTGTPQAPVVNASLDLRNVLLDGESEGDFRADAVTRGANLHLAARSNFEHATLNVDGDVRLRDDFPANLTLNFSRLDIDPLLHAYLKGRITGHSSTVGTITLSGSLRRFRDLTMKGNVDQFSSDVENVKLQNSGPFRFALEQRTLTLESLHLVGNGTDVTASGSAQFSGERKVDLRADGQVNLTIIQTLNPNYLSSGLMMVRVRLDGTMDEPHPHGQVSIQNGAISYIDLPSGFNEINGTLAFNEDRLQIRSLSARTGGGMLNLGGFVAYNNKINFDLTAKGNDIRLRYPPGMSSTADLDLRLSGSPSGSLLSGNILVTRFAVNRDFDFAQYLARVKEAAVTSNPKSPLNNLKIDVHITTAPQLEVQTASAKLSGDADLRVRGTAATPVVLGRVNIAQGDISFNGTKYHMERGDITFANPVRIQPVLDLQATSRVRDYDITLGFHGPPDKLSMTYSSDPPLPPADIIALIAMGRTREDTAIQQQPGTNFTQSASSAILGEALAPSSSNRLEKLFGVGRIKVDPEAGVENNATGTRVTIEQQVSNNLTVTYITNVSQTSQQVVQAEFWLTRSISVIGLRDQNGVVSFDVRIRQRKK